MHHHLSSWRFLPLALSIFILLTVVHPVQVDAGCGCDKPPPVPAVVIPSAAYPGMKVSLFNSTLQEGQTWTVAFQSGGKTTSVKATVVTKRTLTDPTGLTYQPQLVVTVPNGVSMGPTQITATKKGKSFTVPNSSFTTIGKPIVVAAGELSYNLKGYTTGVGADGALYLTLGGLEKACQASGFGTTIKNSPLRFNSGDVVVFNHQGFLIDALNDYTKDHYAMLDPLFSPTTTSTTLFYYRHSFAQYCANHLPGGSKEVNAQDPDWHLDGTPHTEYSTLIFAIAAHLTDNSWLKPGSFTFDVDLLAWLGQSTDAWAPEQEEETVQGGGANKQ